MHSSEYTFSTEKGKTPQRFTPFIIYLLFFYLCWIGWVYFIYPTMQALGTTTLAYALTDIAIRLLIWVVPVFLYLRYIDHVNPITYLKLDQRWKRGILFGLALSVLNFAGMLLRFGLPHPSWHYVTWNSVLGTSILIGFVEEIPFRGFILQKLQEKSRFWLANLLSSLLFLAIHLPGWIMLHTLAVANAVSIFILGVVFATIFYISKSLWSSVIAHSLNDFLSSVIFHLP